MEAITDIVQEKGITQMIEGMKIDIEEELNKRLRIAKMNYEIKKNMEKYCTFSEEFINEMTGGKYKENLYDISVGSCYEEPEPSQREMDILDKILYRLELKEGGEGILDNGKYISKGEKDIPLSTQYKRKNFEKEYDLPYEYMDEVYNSLNK